MLHEEALRQQELGIEVLLLGSVIDDGYPAWHPIPLLARPLLLKHAQHGRIEIVDLGSAQCHLDFGTARTLGLGEQTVQECATGIGIDLDQPRALCGKMEVVAHEGAKRPEVVSRDLGSPR